MKALLVIKTTKYRTISYLNHLIYSNPCNYTMIYTKSRTMSIGCLGTAALVYIRPYYICFILQGVNQTLVKMVEYVHQLYKVRVMRAGAITDLKG